MTTRKILVALLIILVAISGFVAGLYLLRQRQELREEAAVPTGQAKVALKPESGNYNVGDEIPLQIYFNTANIPISGIAVRVKYPYSGSTPEVSVVTDSITINSTLLSTGDWDCPTKTSSEQSGNVYIDIACVLPGSATGYTNNTDTLLGEVKLKVNRATAASPFMVGFDQVESVITRKSDNSDILLIPTSTGSYSIAGAGVQATPTATPRVSPTATPRVSVTATPTTTATRIPSASPTATTKGGEQLPDAGVPFPTMLGIGLGVMVVIGGVLLAL